ncbi:glutathione peroxidase [Thalassotalea euphylliae]|uniref:glutathione peroxidase n=1 Tax=Thalassotalea euphylliae TaxID=1655234 RepID=UPI00363D02BC
MKLAVIASALIAVASMASPEAKAAPSENTEAGASCAPFFDHSFRKLHAKDDVDLCSLTAGKPVLVVNTASNCGFTPQFKALEAVHKKYKDQGLVVIGFPSDDFFQEEDDEKDTAEVCFVNYGVTFTMLQTSAVRGSDANPVFKHLGDETTSPKWNFYKYLVSADGQKVKHFNSRVSPDDEAFIEAIEASL